MQENFESPRNFSPKQPKRRISRIMEKPKREIDGMKGEEENKGEGEGEYEEKLHENGQKSEENEEMSEKRENTTKGEEEGNKHVNENVNEPNDNDGNENDELVDEKKQTTEKFQIPLLNLKKYEDLQEKGFLNEFLIKSSAGSIAASPRHEVTSARLLSHSADVPLSPSSKAPETPTASKGEEVSEERKKLLTEKRRKVALELVKTEKTYLQNLNDLLRVFYEPMYANAIGPEDQRKISLDDVKHIFSNLKVMIGFNSMLLESISSRVDDVPEHSPIVIGDIFLSQAEYLKTYTLYCNEYVNINSIIKKNLENPDFEAFFHSLHDKSIIGDQTIQNFLILPVQRIPRYKLLLNEMLKLTWAGHPDTHLADAYAKISTIAQFIENAQERYSNINKIIAIQSALKQSKHSHLQLLQPHRSFIREYLLDLQELTPHGHVIRKRKLIVFNDLLLVAKALAVDDLKKKKRTPSLSLKYVISVCDIISLHPVVFEGKPSISIIFGEANITLLLESEKEKDELMKCLKALTAEAKSLIKTTAFSPLPPSPSSPSKLKSEGGTEKARKNRSKSNLNNVSPKGEVVIKNPLHNSNLSKRRSMHVMNEQRNDRAFASAQNLVELRKLSRTTRSNTLTNADMPPIDKKKMLTRVSSIDSFRTKDHRESILKRSLTDSNNNTDEL